MDSKAQEIADKRKAEYNKTADQYEAWCAENFVMQNYCYHSTASEIESSGIKGKTVLEIGCGPCPIGQRIAGKAAKIYGVDISSEMIEASKKGLTNLGIADKFEFIVADILDPSFVVPEKVDVAVLSYTYSTFIDSYDKLVTLLQRCKDSIKPDGYVLLVDFEYVPIPCDNFWMGMYTTYHGEGDRPKNFETFNFFHDKSPEMPYGIYHIPAELIFKAAIQVGLKKIVHKLQYPSESIAKDPRFLRYIRECKPHDYIFKLQV